MTGRPDVAVLAEVLDLYARQAQAIDTGDAEGWAATFADDGVFDSPSYPLPAAGQAELARFARDVAADAATHGHALQHWVSAVALEALHDGDLAGRAYLSLVAVAPGEPPRPLRNVWLSDRLTRTSAGWRFRRRDVSLTPPSTLPVPAAR